MTRQKSSASVMLWMVVVASVVLASEHNGTRYGFYREMGRGAGADGSGTRRVFGGTAAQLSEFPASCVLLDRYWGTRCSGAVVAPRWALTAAHCVSPRLAYVKYNARRTAAPDGDVAPVHYLYQHPGYKVVQEDEGRGLDVTALHHDVGLVRTRRDMRLLADPPMDALIAMTLYNPVDLHDKDVLVFGFGRTEGSAMGEELFRVQLRLAACERGSWYHCVCGAARGAEHGVTSGAARGGDAGVCSGDSGGPVVWRGAQVGVTSMGPVECGAGGVAAGAGATSVFTALHAYAHLLNATIHDTDAELRMRIISAAHARAPLLPLLLSLCILHAPYYAE